jgi:hypothetical protein
VVPVKNFRDQPPGGSLRIPTKRENMKNLKEKGEKMLFTTCELASAPLPRTVRKKRQPEDLLGVRRSFRPTPMHASMIGQLAPETATRDPPSPEVAENLGRLVRG